MRRVQRGFTLMEVMIALVLISLVMAMLFAGLRSVARSWDAAEARTSDGSQIRAVEEFLRAKLRQSWSVQVRHDRGAFSAFSGDSEQLRFVAPMMNQLGPPGLYLVEIRLEKDVLSLRLAPYDHEVGEDALDESESYPLIEGVNKFEVGYYGALDRTQDPEWVEEWQEQPNPPLMVRIAVQRHGVNWPELVVALPQ